MINYKKIFILIVIFISFNNLSFAEIPRYIDFKYLLNESIAGKKAQTFLKNKLEKGIKDIKSKEKKIQEEEKKLFSKRKSYLQKSIKSRLQL